MKMFGDLGNNPFVCLDDITGRREDLNYVIYNPTKDSPHERINKLYEKVKECFGIELTSDQLTQLTKYDTYQLKNFIVELKEIIKESKKKQ